MPVPHDLTDKNTLLEMHAPALAAVIDPLWFLALVIAVCLAALVLDHVYPPPGWSRQPDKTDGARDAEGPHDDE